MKNHKFEKGDIVYLTITTNMVAPYGSLAVVTGYAMYNNNSKEYMNVNWDRSQKYHAQCNGGYEESQFNLHFRPSVEQSRWQQINEEINEEQN